MNTRKLYYWHHRLHFLKAWYFLIPAVFFLILAVQGLRSNYSTMVELREEVYKADRENGDVEKALQKLRTHVHSHMNTNLSSGSSAIKPPIQLKARYERLQAAEKEKTRKQNAAITARAEQICAGRFPQAGFNAPRVACVQEYLRVNAVEDNPVPENLYKFDFISPRWSPDLAGISMLLSVIFFILFAARVLIERYMQKRLQ